MVSCRCDKTRSEVKTGAGAGTEAEPGRRNDAASWAYWLLLQDHIQTPFLDLPGPLRTTCPGDATPTVIWELSTVIWELPNQSLVNVSDSPTGQSGGGIFSAEGLSSQTTQFVSR